MSENLGVGWTHTVCIQCYLYNGPVIILVLVWHSQSTFHKNIHGKWFLHFIPSDLDLWPLDHKFAAIVTLVHCYVSTKLLVSITFLFRENWWRGLDTQSHMDAMLNAGPREGPIITVRFTGQLNVTWTTHWQTPNLTTNWVAGVVQNIQKSQM